MALEFIDIHPRHSLRALDRRPQHKRAFILSRMLGHRPSKHCTIDQTLPSE